MIAEYGVYIQPINYPTVPKGTERLRITPGPFHADVQIDHLVEALVEVWGRLDLRREERIGVVNRQMRRG